MRDGLVHNLFLNSTCSSSVMNSRTGIHIASVQGIFRLPVFLRQYTIIDTYMLLVLNPALAFTSL